MLRVKKCVPNCTSPTTTTIYVFSGSKVVAEYENGAAVNAPTREYIYLGSQLLAKHEGGTLTYFHQDHLSNRVMTNTSGDIAAQSGHFPFGENWYARDGSGNSITPDKLKFTSYERDAESGNDYAIFRTYLNRFGRFSSVDPLEGSITGPQSLNRFAYVLNDPVRLIDPLGLECIIDGQADPSIISPGECARKGGAWRYADTTVEVQADGTTIVWGYLPVPTSLVAPGVVDSSEPSGQRGILERLISAAKEVAEAACSLVPDAVSSSAGFDFGEFLTAGAQISLVANGRSGEYSIYLGFTASAGVIGTDAYVSFGVTPDAPNGPSENVSVNTVVAGQRTGISMPLYPGPRQGSWQVTVGPSTMPVTGAVQASYSQALVTFPYLGYASNLPRAICKAVTGN